MTEHPSNGPESTIEAVSEPTGSGAAPGRGTSLQHVTVERDGVAVCTMFPSRLDRADASAAWLTATDESFVALADAR
ncbi:DUF7511 domain-containing protein [Natronolimnohabitans innermongolicus]|uniref:DUF7511 domain-containing protein n=1 Tax=Natronolimnohabitans innermongolicus JCM 12255 TaxID=1227499 RepID=L9WJ79_9EURY|nr:hypothetical protein [Natronolimnohabitans innermongolicus]ELY49525.1 hypothetical protein C493_20274 [Natronolimnohabitans innermongolicus JCM 12255]